LPKHELLPVSRRNICTKIAQTSLIVGVIGNGKSIGEISISIVVGHNPVPLSNIYLGLEKEQLSAHSMAQ